MFDRKLFINIPNILEFRMFIQENVSFTHYTHISKISLSRTYNFHIHFLPKILLHGQF